MKTQCSLPGFEFQPLKKRKVVAEFSQNQISSDAGGLLLREYDLATGLINRVAKCFKDFRRKDRIEHDVETLLRQRITGIALGHEDLIDHDTLRFDPLFATIANTEDPTGANRFKKGDRGAALAGKSTLDRLESATEKMQDGEIYCKFEVDKQAFEKVFVDHFLEAHANPPAEIILDVDATDDPLYGKQEGRFFHGYYGHYCYLPLYIFCGDFLLAAKLRPSNIDGCLGTVEELERIVGQIRQAWPDTRIILRGDSGFARDHIMSWCEDNEVYYILGLAKNERLKGAMSKQIERARRKHLWTRHPARIFHGFTYRTRSSWTRSRFVVGKAEHLEKGPNPRFIVVHLPKNYAIPRDIYEQHYCARGDMENRIKEQQMALFADRTSCQMMMENQLRLWFSSLAYLLVDGIRRVGLKGTELARAQAWTIRNKLLKIGALVKVSVRRVHIVLSGNYPYKDLFKRAVYKIQALARGPNVQCGS